MADTDATPETEGAPTGRAFQVLRVYLKDFSFESPKAPLCFREEWKPQFNLQFGSAATRLDSTTYEVVIALTLSAQSGENTAYVAEIQQAGLFGISGYGDDELNSIISRTCPNLLLPFAREAISDVVLKGGFPQYVFSIVSVDQFVGAAPRASGQAAEGE